MIICKNCYQVCFFSRKFKWFLCWWFIMFVFLPIFHLVFQVTFIRLLPTFSSWNIFSQIFILKHSVCLEGCKPYRSPINFVLVKSVKLVLIIWSLILILREHFNLLSLICGWVLVHEKYRFLRCSLFNLHFDWLVILRLLLLTNYHIEICCK